MAGLGIDRVRMDMTSWLPVNPNPVLLLNWILLQNFFHKTEVAQNYKKKLGDHMVTLPLHQIKYKAGKISYWPDQNRVYRAQEQQPTRA